MPDRLLICTDLDRTLIPNGPQPESSGARERFAALVARPEVALAYVSGRDRGLVQAALARYRLPLPDFVLGDVGTSIYRVEAGLEWRREPAWEAEIARDWNGLARSDLQQKLRHLQPLRLQEEARQNRYKLSFYLPLQADRDALAARIEQCAAALGARLRLVWSVDEAAGTGLLDVLPERASKYHAIAALMRQQGYSEANTVFCGDSGNDLEVLVSPLAAVLVANSPAEVQALAQRGAAAAGHANRLYLARGKFMGLNGNYSAGILEGIAHYHPDTIAWMGFAEEASRA